MAPELFDCKTKITEKIDVGEPRVDILGRKPLRHKGGKSEFIIRPYFCKMGVKHL